MFKLVSLTALICLSSVAAESKEEIEENKLKKNWEAQQSKIKSMSSSPTSKVWSEKKNAKNANYWSFQGASEA